MTSTLRLWITGGLVALTLGLILVAAGAGGAHVLNSDGNWYIDGSFYDADEVSDDARKDPFNLMFIGEDNVSLDRVEAHLLDDWDGDGPMTNDLVCRSSLYAAWRFFPEIDLDKQDRQFVDTNFLCRRQYHIRLWDDLEHSRGTAHGALNQWVVAGIHHERVVYRKPCCFRHKPDRDWDSVRIQALKAMDTHCSTRRWRMHPGAAKTYQGYHNLGYIGAISLRHRASGC